MKKKILSILLTFAMLFSSVAVLTTTVMAEVTATTIATYDELVAFLASLETKDYAGETVTVTADITVNDGWKANNGEAAATAAPAVVTQGSTGTFKGTLDGQGHTLKGLYIEGRGLIQVLTDATVKNLTFENCYLDNTEEVPAANPRPYVGLLASEINGTANTVSNVTFKGCKAYEDHYYFGAIAGGVTGGTLTVSNCHNVDGAFYLVSNGTGLLGGLISTLENQKGVIATLTDCSNTSYLNSTKLSAGGMKVGGMISCTNDATVTLVNCVNAGEIYGSTLAGGMLADVRGNTSLTNCVNSGKLTSGDAEHNGNSYTAGMVTQNYNATATITMVNCINTGAIKAQTVTSKDSNSNYSKNSFAAGLLAYSNKPATFTACVNTGPVDSMKHAGGIVGIISGALTIDTCANLAPINGAQRIGGLIGEFGNALTVKDSINMGEVASTDGNSWVGGLSGYSSQNTAIEVSDFINTAAISSANRGGGIMGTYRSKTGTFTRVLSVAPVTGKNDYSSGAFFGNWAEKNTDATLFLHLVDCYFLNTVKGQFNGMYSTNAQNGNLKISFTGKEDATFIGGVNNEGVTAAWPNFQAYRDFVAGTGARITADKIDGVNAALNLKGYDFGEKWILRDTAPMPLKAALLLSDYAETPEEGAISYKGIQSKAVADGKFDLRVVAGLNDLAFQETGFDLYVVNKDGSALKQTAASNVVYSSLNVYGETEVITAESMNCKYLSAITVTGIPAEGTYTLVIKPCVTASDGSGIEYGASYAAVIVNGVIVAHYAM